MANETILRGGYISTSDGVVEGTLSAEALRVINTSGVTQFTLPTADGTAGYAMTTNGSGTLSWSEIPDVSSFITGIGAFDLGDLNNVDETGVNTGDLIQYNGSTWVTVAATTVGVTALADLSDVTITAAAAGDFLRYDGSAWVDSTIQDSDISQTAVTQYESNLSIDITQVDNFTPGDYVLTSAVGAANGVASLDSNGLVPSSQLPSYVDDVLEYANEASFPATGETGKLYVDLSDNSVHRWSGSAYIDITDYSTPGHTHVAADITDFDTEVDNQIAAASVGDLSDVDIAGVANEQVLAWNSTNTQFEPINVSSLSTSDSVSSLTDTTIGTLSANEILVYTGSEWENKPISYLNLVVDSDIANMVETTDSVTVLSDVTNIGSDGDIIVNSSGALVGVSTITSSSISNFETAVDTIISNTTLSELASGSITDLDEVSTVGTSGQILISDGTNLVASDRVLMKAFSVSAVSGDGASQILAVALSGGKGAEIVNYVIDNGTSMRVGTLRIVSDGVNVELTDISTNKIGIEAAEPYFDTTISGANVLIRINNGDGYTVKGNYFGNFVD